MTSTLSSIRCTLTVLAGGLALLAPGVARAAAPISYKIQSLVKAGDMVGDVQISPHARGLFVGGLNDKGQFLLDADIPFGGEALLQYSDGHFTPLLAAGQDGPLGPWPKGTGVNLPVSMNQQGDAVFTAASDSTGVPIGTFRWDYKIQQLVTVAVKEMPAVDNLTFEQGGTGWGAAHNNQDEIAFPAAVKNAAGQKRDGVFLMDPQGHLQSVALPDQALPDGKKVGSAWLPSLNDAGLIALVVGGSAVQSEGLGAYLWEKGAITPIAVTGMATPDGGKLAGIREVWMNNRNRDLLLAARPQGSGTGLYRFTNGQLLSVVAAGQEMPGGGQLQSLQVGPGPGWGNGVSAANEAGQHAFLAGLKGGATGAYLVDTDGKVTLILKSGTLTDLGTITRVGAPGSGIGLNSQGQVALSVTIDDGPETLVLLTPAAP